MASSDKKAKVTVEFNVQNEQVVLASVFLDRALREKWIGELSPDEFVGNRHRVLARVAAGMAARGLEYSEDTVELLAEGEDYGGVRYLRDLLQTYAANPNMEEHVARLRRDTARYRIRTGPLQQAVEIAENPHATDEELAAALGKAGTLLHSRTGRGAEKGRKLAERYLKDLYERPGLFPFHFKALDEKLTEGLAPKRITLIAGRPGMGKSTVCANLVLRQALRKKRVGVFPAERGTDSLVDGMICARARLDLEKLVKNPRDLGAEERALIEKAAHDLFEDEYIEIDPRRHSLDELENIIVNGDVEIALIDLFEKFLRSLDTQRIAEALNRIQDIAKRGRRGKGTHFILFHQIRRGLEKTKNHRPSLEMLKNSGGYEEVPDLIFLLHREKYYEKELDRDVIEFYCAKQTRGEAGWTAAYEFEAKQSRIGKHVPNWFEELDGLSV